MMVGKWGEVRYVTMTLIAVIKGMPIAKKNGPLMSGPLNLLERKTGIGPATPTLARLCSTSELLPHFQVVDGGGTQS